MMVRRRISLVCCLLLAVGPSVVQARETVRQRPTQTPAAAPQNTEAPQPTAPKSENAAPTVGAAPAKEPSKTKELLTDAAVVAAIIAASVALYKSQSGGPCACPSDVDRAGRSCGKRSAHDRAGGYSVTCYAHEVTTEMMAAYRKAREAVVAKP